MKVEESCQKVVWEGVVGKDAFRLVEEQRSDEILLIIQPLGETTLSDIAKGVKTFAKAHPVLTGVVATQAWDAVKQYYKNKDKAVKFHAPDLTLRSSYQKIVDQLVKTTHWKLVKHGYAGSGYEWELVSIR